MTLQQQLEKLRELDPKAAEYIKTVVLPRYEGVDISKRDIGNLFFFELTPQGHDYWFDLYKRVLDVGNG